MADEANGALPLEPEPIPPTPATEPPPPPTLPQLAIVPTADIFDLDTDTGLVHLGWDTPGGRVAVTLRRPLVAEYQSFVEEYETAMRWATENPEPAAVYGVESRNLALWCRIITELGGQALIPADCPAWMLAANALDRVIVHWRLNPLALGVSVELTQALLAATQPPSDSTPTP